MSRTQSCLPHAVRAGLPLVSGQEAPRTPVPGRGAQGSLRSLRLPTALSAEGPPQVHTLPGCTPLGTATAQGSLCSPAGPRPGGKHAAHNRCSARSQRARALLKRTHASVSNRLMRGPEPRVKNMP